jgi:hypothetical protein
LLCFAVAALQTLKAFSVERLVDNLGCVLVKAAAARDDVGVGALCHDIDALVAPFTELLVSVVSDVMLLHRVRGAEEAALLLFVLP